VLRFTQQLVHLVVDLLDVRLAARRLDDLGTVGLDLLVTLPAHVLRQDDTAAIAHARRHPSAADPEVAGRWTQDRVLAGARLTSQLLFDQDRIGRPDLVAAGGEVTSGEHDDLGGDAGQSLRNARVVHGAGIVLPGQVEEIERIERLRTRRRGARPQLGRQAARVTHFGERGSVNERRSGGHRDSSSSGRRAF
jgi:hypothetical protein